MGKNKIRWGNMICGVPLIGEDKKGEGKRSSNGWGKNK